MELTCESLVSVILAENTRNAEITDLDIKLLQAINHDILEFQIPVHNLPLMTIINGIHDLPEYKLRLCFPHEPSFLFLQIFG